MDDLMLPLPGLSPVCGKSIVARFDGGQMSSDAGVLVLRAIEQRLGVAERLAGCIEDPRTQAQVVHGLADMIRFRTFMIASAYEDGNDATAMRSDPAFKLAQDVLPSGPDLASQPTLSRLENWPDLRALLTVRRTARSGVLSSSNTAQACLSMKAAASRSRIEPRRSFCPAAFASANMPVTTTSKRSSTSSWALASSVRM